MGRGKERKELSRDWLVAAGIIAVPIVLFGLMELLAYRRRQREKAVAQRSKRRAEDRRSSRGRGGSEIAS